MGLPEKPPPITTASLRIKSHKLWSQSRLSIISMLQKRKLKLRELPTVAQGHIAREPGC